MHPLYAKTAAAHQLAVDRGRPDSPVYLETTQVAGLLRQQLKAAFPAVKFSVRSSGYSGGSSIDVRWTDGPPPAAVEPLAQAFAFGNFDSSIDLKTSCRHWLLPDGSLSFASTRGSEASGGSIPAETAAAPHPEALLVSGGPDFVFCHREVSSPATCHVEHDRLPWGGPCGACGSREAVRDTVWP